MVLSLQYYFIRSLSSKKKIKKSKESAHKKNKRKKKKRNASRKWQFNENTSNIPIYIRFRETLKVFDSLDKAATWNEYTISIAYS